MKSSPVGGQVPQTAEVVRADGRGGLDLDADHLARRFSRTASTSTLSLVAVVEQLGALARPGELAGQFHQDEPLEQRAEPAAGPQQARASAPSRLAAIPESVKASLGVPTARVLTLRDQAGIRLTRKTSSSRLR